MVVGSEFPGEGCRHVMLFFGLRWDKGRKYRSPGSKEHQKDFCEPHARAAHISFVRICPRVWFIRQIESYMVRMRVCMSTVLRCAMEAMCLGYFGGGVQAQSTAQDAGVVTRHVPRADRGLIGNLVNGSRRVVGWMAVF